MCAYSDDTHSIVECIRAGVGFTISNHIKKIQYARLIEPIDACKIEIYFVWEPSHRVILLFFVPLFVCVCVCVMWEIIEEVLLDICERNIHAIEWISIENTLPCGHSIISMAYMCTIACILHPYVPIENRIAKQFFFSSMSWINFRRHIISFWGKLKWRKCSWVT